MHLTKTIQITVTGKTKKKCEEVFTMIRSICNTSVSEVGEPREFAEEHTDKGGYFFICNKDNREECKNFTKALSKLIRGEG